MIKLKDFPAWQPDGFSKKGLNGEIKTFHNKFFKL